MGGIYKCHYYDVQEVFPVLKQGGQFMIMSEIYKINYHMKSYIKKTDIQQLFESIGFQMVNIEEDTKKLALYYRHEIV